MHWRIVLLATVLAAGCLTSACRETTPTSPGTVAEGDSSQRSRPTPPPPNPPAPPSTPANCDATKAQWAIGERASNDLLERARVAAGAGSARFLRPDEPVTMEYLGSRLNLGLDAQDIVRAVVCG
jgi:Peptidase inhibitor I78 family